MMMSSSMVMKKDNFTVLGHCCIIRYMRVHHRASDPVAADGLIGINSPNYGQRYHHGEAIATGFVESTVNQLVSKRFCKKQQMQWSKPGAHLLVQTRVKTLDGELGAIFKRWYPDMDIEVDEMPVAA
jgi:hypothetical protein